MFSDVSAIGAASSQRSLRVLTYNVHSCRGSDRRHDPARIAEVIASAQADVVALQEVDVGRKRTGGVDQAEEIAALLKMQAHFHPALHLEDEKYGDAILTTLPSKLVRAAALPSFGEPRGAIWLEVEHAGVKLQMFNTHFGLGRRERALQVEALLGPGWIGHERCRRAPIVLLGDFNAVPRSSSYRTLADRLKAIVPRKEGRWRATFPSRLPLLRLDHIFVSPDMLEGKASVVESTLARRASDHLPVMADINFRDRSGRA